MDIYLEWNEDLIITPNGSIQFATGWDQVRERIIRNLITNAAQALANGSTTPPDYVFHPSFGIGLGAKVDAVMTPDQIQDLVRMINNAVLADANIDPGTAPQITVTGANTSTFQILIQVQLINGQSGQIAFNFGSNS